MPNDEGQPEATGHGWMADAAKLLTDQKGVGEYLTTHLAKGLQQAPPMIVDASAELASRVTMRSPKGKLMVFILTVILDEDPEEEEDEEPPPPKKRRH